MAQNLILLGGITDRVMVCLSFMKEFISQKRFMKAVINEGLLLAICGVAQTPLNLSRASLDIITVSIFRDGLLTSLLGLL